MFWHMTNERTDLIIAIIMILKHFIEEFSELFMHKLYFFIVQITSTISDFIVIQLFFSFIKK